MRVSEPDQTISDRKGLRHRALHYLRTEITPSAYRPGFRVERLSESNAFLLLS